MKSNQKGFVATEVVLLVVIVGVLSAVGWYVYSASQNTKKSPRVISKVVDKYQAALIGTVTEGPVSPVSTPGNSGVSVVANHVIQAENAQSKVVASTKTDSQGKYEFHLPLGQYTLVLVPKIGMGAIRGNTIQVVAGKNTLDLVADTGIR